MTDYIKREDAIEEINKTLNMFGREHTITDYDAIDCILTVPSADVIEVVRCKDCKHNYRRKTWNHGERDNPGCKYTNYVRDNDFYCGYGERAEV